MVLDQIWRHQGMVMVTSSLFFSLCMKLASGWRSVHRELFLVHSIPTVDRF
jgi:hypothetical protein